MLFLHWYIWTWVCFLCCTFLLHHTPHFWAHFFIILLFSLLYVVIAWPFCLFVVVFSIFNHVLPFICNNFHVNRKCAICKYGVATFSCFQFRKLCILFFIFLLPFCGKLIFGLEISLITRPVLHLLVLFACFFHYWRCLVIVLWLVLLNYIIFERFCVR